MRFFRNLILVVVTAAVGGCADGGITGPEQEAFTVVGVVTSAVDGSPLSGVLLRAYEIRCPGCTLTTGKSVKYTYASVYSGDDGYYELTGSAESVGGFCHFTVETEHRLYSRAWKFLSCGNSQQEDRARE